MRYDDPMLPAGAASDPDAPYNEPLEVECPRCDGTGKYFSVWNCVRHQDIPCDEETYLAAYDDTSEEFATEAEMIEAGITVVRCDNCECDLCNGRGVVYEYQLRDTEYDPDEEEQYYEDLADEMRLYRDND